MKIVPCIIGLGYVGLPITLSLAKNYNTYGFDINKLRIKSLKRKQDDNREFDKKKFYNLKKIVFTNKVSTIKKCNFFILALPTPINKNKKPNLKYLNFAIRTISKVLKKNDIVFIESTVFPGFTAQSINYLEKKTKLKNGKDFFVGYSPERVNPGDKKYTLKKIKKIVAIKSKNKNVLRKINNVYNKISKKIVISKNIKEAETAKVIENIQRDLNIALMNEILLICKKLKINFNEVIRLAKTKWNFINFKPGLVGGHCLPIDPYYLSSIAEKNNLKLEVTLAGRKINDEMQNFVIRELKEFLRKKNKSMKKSKILIIGLTYKAGVADMRNSLNFEIFQKIKKFNSNLSAVDPFVSEKVKKKFSLLNKINYKIKYDAIIFLSYHKIFYKLYKNILSSINRDCLLDPFCYYS